MTMYTSLLIACLPSGRTHFQASSQKEDQTIITLIFEFMGDKQLPIMNQFVIELFCISYLSTS